MLNAIEQLATEIGELLAGSNIDKRLKDAILDNLDAMPENLVFKLRDALATERAELDGALYDIQMFLKKQEERWAKLEDEQRKVGKDVEDQLFEHLKDQP